MNDEDNPSRGRFHVEALPCDDGPFQLPSHEAAHATASRRLVIGDSLTLFDGSGWELIARIDSASRSRLIVVPVSRRMAGHALAVPVTCATSLPKGSREDMLVSKCAELAVTRIVPIDFARSVVKASIHWAKRRERYKRLAIEAAKQSGQATITGFSDPVDLPRFLASRPGGLLLIGDPAADASVLGVLNARWPFQAVTFLVGPEGGVTEDESAAARRAGFAPVRLAPTTLRIETACIAFATVIAAMLVSERGKEVAK